MAVRNIIRDEGYEKLKAVATKRNAILSGKRQIVDEKYILTTPGVHDSLVVWEKKIQRKGRLLGQNRVEEGQVRMSRSLLMSLKLCS